MVATTDIPEGLTIYMTDNAWTGSTFRSNEGTVKLTIPEGGIPKGEIITFGGDMNYDTTPFTSLWENDRCNFALSTRGDNIMVYCLTTDDDASSYSHLTALSFSGNGWESDDEIERNFSSSDSALPSVLRENGTFITLDQTDNLYYNGLRSGTREEILGFISNEENWVQTSSEDSSHGASSSLIDSQVMLRDFDVGELQGYRSFTTFLSIPIQYYYNNSIFFP
mmetsp:Transcript_8797/g.10216  ORF Transcript_8797/g.10216 Transcript_8797/m.10216 type:complete len:223 (+) Transcript_8797:714-1382(+)